MGTGAMASDTHTYDRSPNACILTNIKCFDHIVRNTEDSRGKGGVTRGQQQADLDFALSIAAASSAWHRGAATWRD